MERTLAVLNDLVDAGIVARYAIGGAVAAIFWVEPFDTIDLDVFVYLPANTHPLDPLRSIVEYLISHGYAFEGEFISIEGVPVQFLPAEDAAGLKKAAVDAAVDHMYLGKVPTRVMSPEYLIALALDTHRSKGYERVGKLLGETTVDRSRVRDLASYGLAPYWEIFLQRYPEFR